MKNYDKKTKKLTTFQIKLPKYAAKKIKIKLICDIKNSIYFQGNKRWKLKHNLIEAKKQQYNTLLTFGGAFSNHIAAVATAGQLFNFNTIGIIRGEIPSKLNPTLAYAKSQGMELIPISREEYRKKQELDFIKKIKTQFKQPYILPEGGTNTLALQGCAEIIDTIDFPYNYICAPCGTGGTLAGLILGTKNNGKVLGFPALKGGNFLRKDIQNLLGEANSIASNWDLITDYHFGGYAKFKPNLIDFINQFKATYQIQLDPIYTGKMLFGIFDLIEKDYFPKGSTIVAIHTGGLQGIQGFNNRFGNILETRK